MEATFQWLADIFNGILKFLPRLRVVPETEGGVVYWYGKAQEVKSGALLFWWPLVASIQMVDKNLQTINLPSQILTLADNNTCVLKGLIVYRYRECKPALIALRNVDEAIRDFGTIAMREFAQGKTMEALKSMSAKEVSKELSAILQTYVSGLYLDINKTAITDIAPCRVFKVFTNAEKDNDIWEYASERLE